MVFSGPNSGSLAANFIKISKQFISDDFEPNLSFVARPTHIHDPRKRSHGQWWRHEQAGNCLYCQQPCFLPICSQLAKRQGNRLGYSSLINIAKWWQLDHCHVWSWGDWPWHFLSQNCIRRRVTVCGRTLPCSKATPNWREDFVHESHAFFWKWETLTRKIKTEDQDQEMLTETASSSLETSKNHRQMSNRVHLPWFRCAFVNELVTYPEGTVWEHNRRIYEANDRQFPSFSRTTIGRYYSVHKHSQHPSVYSDYCVHWRHE